MRSVQLSAFVVLTFFALAATTIAQNNMTVTSSGEAPGGNVAVEINAVGDTNSIWVEDAGAGAGGTAVITVKLTSDTDVHAVSFELQFDQAALQIKPLSDNSVTAGSDASGLDIPVLDDELIASANSSGGLPIYMLHLNIDPEVAMNKISAGADREVLIVKFEVGADVAPGELTIGLASADLVRIADDDSTTVVIEVISRDGTLTISEFVQGDATGDGKVDIFDLLAVLKAMSGIPSVGPSDVNGDGKTNIFDILALLKLL